MHKCNKEQHDLCINNAKCVLCDGQRLFKKPKFIERIEKQKERKAQGIKKKKKEGMDFEKRVTKKYNSKFGKNPSSNDTRGIARRRPNSGAIWSLPGDIITPEELIECKERGSTTSRGEKTFTVQRQQLEKIKQEAYLAGRNQWYLVFGFKEDSNIYVIKNFEDELMMLEHLRTFKEQLNDNLGGDA